jgi:hypothetical protein
VAGPSPAMTQTERADASYQRPEILTLLA